MSHSIDVTMIFVGFTTSQQESKKSSTFSANQKQKPDQEQFFRSRNGVGVKKSDSDHLYIMR